MTRFNSKDYAGLLRALRAFRLKFGAAAAAKHEAQVARLCKATQAEIEEGIRSIRSRNHWNKEPQFSRPPARRDAKVPVRKTVDDTRGPGQRVGPPGAPRISKKPSFQQPTPVRQGPNKARRAEAIERAGSKIIDLAKAAITKAAEKLGT